MRVTRTPSGGRQVKQNCPSADVELSGLKPFVDSNAGHEAVSVARFVSKYAGSEAGAPPRPGTTAGSQ